MDYALWLLGRRAYTVHDLREKMKGRLEKMKDAPDEADRPALMDRVVVRLEELRFLDDLKYCEQWVEERSRIRPRGRYALTQELRKKGVSKDVLETFWESEKGHALDEVPLALSLIEKRAPRLQKKHQGYELKQKLYAFLASRGFGPGVIREALDKAELQY